MCYVSHYFYQPLERVGGFKSVQKYIGWGGILNFQSGGKSDEDFKKVFKNFDFNFITKQFHHLHHHTYGGGGGGVSVQ